MALEITAAIASIKALSDGIRLAFDAKVDADVQAARIAVMDQLGKAQDTLYDLRDELFRIQSENEELKRTAGSSAKWDETFAQYEFVQSPGGAYAFRSRTDANLFACPTCMHDKRVSALQPRGAMPSNRWCLVCEKSYTVTTEKLPSFHALPVSRGPQGWMR
jgi:hypothetical protein